VDAEVFDAPLFKVLAKNDTGKAASNQGGPVIPKELQAYLPEIERPAGVHAPGMEIDAILMIGATEVDRVKARYQVQTWGSTRLLGEFRITRIPAIHKESNAGDIFVVERSLVNRNLSRLTLLKQGTDQFSEASANTRKRQSAPERSRIILTHTNDEVRALNEAARERMRTAGDLGDDVRVTVERGERSFASGDRVMFLQNERGLGVKNGTLGTIEQVNAQSMTVQTDDGRSVRFDLKDYHRIDHGYAATIHKAQGMTVDRAHVMATPGMDAHSSYVALSRHRDGVELHYGRDDFAGEGRLVRTLSRDRAKDMASDYEQRDPAESYAERRGITFRERVAEIVRKVVPEKLRDVFDGLSSPEDVPGPAGGRRLARDTPEREKSDTQAPRRETEAPERKMAEDPEKEMRRFRTRMLVRHARAVDAIFEAQEMGGEATPEQVKELQKARKIFEEVRPYGSVDAEAAYKKDPDLAHEAAGGRVNRAIRALQLETEMRINPSRRADLFVERWQELGDTRQRQYQAGDISGYRSTRAAMGDMVRSLERDPQLESVLENRKRELGIAFESGRRLGLELAFAHGIDLGRSRGIEI
jgi:hypothetical protein